MVPNINKRGQSFKGVTAYLLHDKDNALTADRVGFTETANMHTNDIEAASRFMAWTDLNRDHLKENSAGRSASAGNVYHYSIAWKDGHNPDAEHMKETAHSSAARLGLSEHQYFMVEHTEEDHKHVHIVVNLVHPETGKIANVKSDYNKLDKWANEYQLEHGIVCENRAKKWEAWEQDRPAFTEKERKAHYKEVATNIYNQSDSGQAFAAGLESEGLTLAQKSNGRGGLLVVDEQGEVYGLTRLIDNAKKKDVEQRLEGVDLKALPLADELAREREEQQQEIKRQQEEQKRQEQSQALDMLADIVADELEEERNSSHDIKNAQEITDEALQLDRDALQDLSLWDGDKTQSQRQPEPTELLPSDAARDYAEYSGMQPLSGSGGSGRNSEGAPSPASGEIQDYAGGFEGSYSRDDQETLRQIELEVAATKHALEQEKLEARAAAITKGLQIEVKQQAKLDWAEMKERHRAQLAEKEQRLREIDSPKEAKHRAYYQGIIDNYNDEKAQLEKIDNSMFSRLVFRLKNGISARDEIANTEKSIDSAQERLNSGVGGLNGADYRKLSELRKTHDEQRDALKSRIDKALRQAEEEGQSRAREEQQAKLIREAESSPEAAERLTDTVQPKTSAERERAAHIRNKAEERKASKAAAVRDVQERSKEAAEREKTAQEHYKSALNQEFDQTRQQAEPDKAARARELEARAAELERNIEHLERGRGVDIDRDISDNDHDLSR